jgi:hypothetical protein
VIAAMAQGKSQNTSILKMESVLNVEVLDQTLDKLYFLSISPLYHNKQSKRL